MTFVLLNRNRAKQACFKYEPANNYDMTNANCTETDNTNYY